MLYGNELEKNYNEGLKILVIGVGGAGNNAINRMVEEGIRNVEFVAVNTEEQILKQSKADKIIHIGKETTKGLGAGSNPVLGEMAARESEDDLKKVIEGADMVFVTAGMGGGTGTGAAPVICELSKNMNILTVAIVTKPFVFEGRRRAENAEQGIMKIKNNVDTLIVVENKNLIKTLAKGTTMIEAFKAADETLRKGVQGITDLITIAGYINTDFADVEKVMKNSGVAHIGIGVATGDSRALDAATEAIDSPLSDTSVKGAKGLIVNVTGGLDMALAEVSTAVEYIKTFTDPDATIIFGTDVNEKIKDELMVTVIATGIEDPDDRGVRFNLD